MRWLLILLIALVLLLVIGVAGWWYFTAYRPVVPPESPVEESVSPEISDERLLCTAEFDPVCGNDGTTYSNRCEAERAGAAVVSKGACGAGQ